MKTIFKRLGTGLAALSIFGFVLIPATPSQAAPTYVKRTVETNYIVLAKLKERNPRLYHRVTQGGPAVVTQNEYRQIAALNAEFSSQKKKAKKTSTEFSSQKKARVTVQSSGVRAFLQSGVDFLTGVNKLLVDASVLYPPVALAIPFVSGGILILHLLILAVDLIEGLSAFAATSGRTCFLFWCR